MRAAPALALAGALLGAGTPLAGQFGYFGKNKIQYRGFEWRVLRGPHVDLYYYPEEEELARVALAHAEESYEILARRFNHAVTHRIPLIVYASHADFEQTNLLPFVPPEGLLGFTEFTKRRVAMPFKGSYAQFRHTLRHELVHVFQLSLSSESSQRYPRLRPIGTPLWWSEGLAEFFSEGEDTQDEMVLRELTISGRLPELAELTYLSGGIVYPIGGSIHRFLAATYGEWRVERLYRDLWKYQAFEEAVLGVYGQSLDRLSAEWQHWMRQRYYPAVAEGRPLALTARQIARLAIKPTAYRAADGATGVIYFSPARGYTDIYAQRFDSGGPTAIVRGERGEDFAGFHLFDSRVDVNAAGVLVCSSRYFDRDALFFWSLAERRVVGRYQFPELVSMLSPAWAPDGRSVVFSGLSVSGYSDLYRMWLPEGRLERLTSDRYQDLDPTFSPDGGTVVFSSDRTVFGGGGARNLFALDLASGTVRHLTYGDWHDDGPRWSPETGRIWFTSDRDGRFEVYAIDSTGTGRRMTNTLNGAFDPQWIESEQAILFGGYADLSFNLYVAPPEADSTAPVIALGGEPEPSAWMWTELADGRFSGVDAAPYERRFSLDFAAADALVAPGLGSAGGAAFLFSDLLSDHLVLLAISAAQGTSIGNVFENINGTVFYLNQARRLNWGVGAFRLRGYFSEGDFYDTYFETSTGVFAQLRYPLSRFRRIEGEYRLEYSDRFDLTTGTDVPDPRRVAWLASNYLSYVKDNTLWLSTGPIDGERFHLTGGVVNDVTHGRFDSYVTSVDLRKYVRTSRRGAVAVRALGYFAGGERPRSISIGGTWGIRGYPRYRYIAGTSAWMLNGEWRFPVTDFLALGFPFGIARFPGVQAALFADVGRAWNPGGVERGPVGSAGVGFRMPLGAPLVLRLDLGWRFGSPAGYGLPPGSRDNEFVDFFFGFNY